MGNTSDGAFPSRRYASNPSANCSLAFPGLAPIGELEPLGKGRQIPFGPVIPLRRGGKIVQKDVSRLMRVRRPVGLLEELDDRLSFRKIRLPTGSPLVETWILASDIDKISLRWYS